MRLFRAPRRPARGPGVTLSGPRRGRLASEAPLGLAGPSAARSRRGPRGGPGRRAGRGLLGRAGGGSARGRPPLCTATRCVWLPGRRAWGPIPAAKAPKGTEGKGGGFPEPRRLAPGVDPRGGGSDQDGVFRP